MTTRTREAAAGATDAPAKVEESISVTVAQAAAILRDMSGSLDGAGEAVSGSIRAVSASVASAPDDNVLMGASLAAGVALGLLVGGGPRLLAAAAVCATVSLGAALLQRRPDPRRA